MMSRFAVVVAAAVGLAAQATSQVRDPVPTRIRYEVYGGCTGTPSSPMIDLVFDPTGDQAALVIVNGPEGSLACSLIGSGPAAVTLPYGAIALVEPDIAILPGLFDHASRCPLPWMLSERALIGRSVYFQGVHLGPQSGGHPAIVTFQLSSAIKLDYVAPNRQPPLSYSGPPLTATPIYQRVPIGPAVLPRFDVRTIVQVPSTGWAVRLDSIDPMPHATVVYMTVEAPNPRDIVLPIVTTLPLCVDAGLVPSERIELRLACVTRGVGGHGVYELAAVVETGY